ncbi:hypothetical protein JW977_02755 [Candidatus Falkowbacteria bacterium]|nr:hypothetical protein [Candidatus Falkowbacteria bacterium]
MTTEEKLNKAVWWTLQELKAEFLTTPKDEYLNFRFQNPTKTIPTKIEQKKALILLNNESAINIIKEKYLPSPLNEYEWDWLGIVPTSISVLVDILQPKFDEVYKQYQIIFQKIDIRQDGIFKYNPETGDGELRGEKFKRLKDSGKYKKLFDLAFENRGRKILREDVIKVLNLNGVDNGVDPRKILSALGDETIRKKSIREITITNKINEVVKDIRLKTGLNQKEFVNNSGNIILNI